MECEVPDTAQVTAVSLMQVIQTYLKMTADSYRKQKILNVWEVDREMEVIISGESRLLQCTRLGI